jgi:hypothetical protein
MEISDFKQQDAPMNKGCVYGKGILEHAIRKHGLTRSVVSDKNNVIFVGDKVFRLAKELGIKKVQVVETTGDTLVVVKRIDIESESVKGKEISLSDNLTTQENLEWNADNVIKSANTHFGFNPLEWGGDSCVVQETKIEDLLRQDVTKAPIKEEKQFTPTLQQSLFD